MKCHACHATKYQTHGIRRPLPTAGGARQRRDYKQQVLCSASEGQARGDRKGSQVQSKKPKKGSEKGGAVSANVASERSTKQEVRSKNAEARVNERQKVTFGTLGRSVLRCHGVLVLRQGPPKEHKQAGRWPMKGGQSPSLELVSREFRKQRLAPWAADRGPDPSFAAMVFWCCDTVLQESTGKLAGGR